MAAVIRETPLPRYLALSFPRDQGRPGDYSLTGLHTAIFRRKAGLKRLPIQHASQGVGVEVKG
jgi:hypothetical protein